MAKSPVIRRVAFLGIGIMGRGMAANLVRAGFDVTVWNRTPGRTAALEALGARVASGVGEAVRGADAICLCVTGPGDVEQLVLGPGGVLDHAQPGQIILDHSTIAPAVSRRIAAEASLKDVAALDAPVTGGESGARDGTLTIICGGDQAAFERAQPVLHAMGRKVVLVGGPGAGQTLKLIGNLIGGMTLAATVEGLALGLKAGLDLSVMIEVLRASSANSAFLESSAARILSGDDAPGFSLSNRTKDLRLAMAEAAALGLDLPLGQLTRDLFGQVAEAFPERDQVAYVQRYRPLFPSGAPEGDQRPQ